VSWQARVFVPAPPDALLCSQGYALALEPVDERGALGIQAPHAVPAHAGVSMAGRPLRVPYARRGGQVRARDAP
jgi:hypothetical protein